MNKILIILHHEFVTTLGRRSFLVAAFGLPVVAILVFAVIGLVKRDSSNPGPAGQSGQTEKLLKVEGYVDRSGLIESIPSDIPDGKLLAFQDEDAARQALEAGKIARYYLVPANFVQTGEIVYIFPNAVPPKSDKQDWTIRRTLLFNMLEGDGELADRVWHPANMEVINLAASPEQHRGTGNRPSRWLRYLPAIMSVLFYVFLLTASNILLRNISSEKENRTIEILLLSITPRQLLVGKIVGLGLASFLHTVAWVSAFFVIMKINGYAFDLSEAATIPASLLLWGILFFVLGFAIYASLMAGVGALVPKLKEANHASTIAMGPLLIGYVVGLFAPLAESANAIVPVVLSMFPLTAPIVMMMRLTAGPVPLWQLLLSIGLMILTAQVIVRAVAAMFRAQHLLSGQEFSVKRLFSVLCHHG
jgi:ABC-2 type transport system permease protein